VAARHRPEWQIRFATTVATDLAALRPFDRTQVLDAIDRQLKYQPLEETRNKKVLVGLIPPWAFVAPLRQLRVKRYRVFYDADPAEQTVNVRAVREKRPGEQTEDIL
jgi:mRNA-degrading endonuclease RelE of RelBE toxin-antitoxin system